MPINLLTWSAAVIPIILLLILLIKFKRPIVEAAACSLIAAMAVAVIIYKAPMNLIAGEVAKGLWNSASIMIVIFPAILIYEVSNAVGAFKVIKIYVDKLIANKLLQVLAVGWCFTSFLQGPSGFGVPIAVTAPLLIGIGVKPLWAVVIPLIAQSWGNTFGTLALAWDALLQQCQLTNKEIEETAWVAGIFLWILNAFTGLAICWFYKKWQGIKKGIVAVIIITIVQGGGELILTKDYPALAAFLPSIMALMIIPLIAKISIYKNNEQNEKSIILINEKIEDNTKNNLTLGQAFLPYTILMLMSVAVLMIPALSEPLAKIKTAFDFIATKTEYGFINTEVQNYSAIAWFTHSGFFLLVAAVVAAMYFYQKKFIDINITKNMCNETIKKFMPAALSVAILVAMSKVMGGSGQIDVLAQGTAKATGNVYGIIAPTVGMLGSFMSASNVSSNVLFGQFQESMARLTGLSKIVVLAAQTSGAAIGTMFSPSKVLLGTITAGIIGKEGEIIKKVLPVAIITAAIIGLLVMILG